MQLGWYNPQTFKVKEYEEFERVDNGDMNWIIPGKFLAFSAPSNSQYDEDGYRTFTPEDYVANFKKWKINLVVRLNNVTYDKDKFTKNGVKHMELYFTDGSTPSDEIVNTFLEAAEKEKYAIAVHCKAGLGRTGSLIAAYALKHYKFPADAFIGYIRICRPGSVLGPQQQYLCDIQEKMFKLGDTYRKKNNLTDEVCLKLDNLSLVEKVSKQTKEDLDRKVNGDNGQADRLNQAKRNNKTYK